MKIILSPIEDDERLDSIATKPPITFTLENFIETIREYVLENEEWNFILKLEPEENET